VIIMGNIIKCRGGILLNEQLDELYSGYDAEEEELEEITEEDLKDFFGIESEDNDFEDNLSEDDKYFLRLCKDRQRA